MTPEQRQRKNERQRLWRAADPERVRAYRRKSYLADPEKAKEQVRRSRERNPERYSEYMVAYRATNALALAEYGKTYRMLNAEKVKAWQQERTASGRAAAATRKRLAANPDYGRDAARERRALRRGAFVERVRRAEIFERDGWVCQLCERPIDRDAPWPQPLSPSIDHIVPLCRGGAEEPRNVQAAHLGCNLRKSYPRSVQ